MTAHDQLRAMLDQLMGTSRNGEDERAMIKFDDPRTCKSFLLGCCPHDILASTRMDLGECPKYHNVALRADYEKASKHKDYFYDLDALEQLEVFIRDADRKTDQAKKRLAETQEEVSSEVQTKADKIHDLAEKIGENLAKAEKLGADGHVEESMKLMEEVEDLRKQKSDAESEYRAAIPAAAYQQQKLRVCEVCGAYLGIHDNDRRLADHFGGKLHLGFIKLRDTLVEFERIADDRRRQRREYLRSIRLSEEREARRREKDLRKGAEKNNERSRSRSSRDREKSRDKDRERDRDRDKDRSRDKDRERRHKRRHDSRSPSARNGRSHHHHKKRKSSKSKSISPSRDKDRKDKEKKSRSKRSRSRSSSHRRKKGSSKRSKSNSSSGSERQSGRGDVGSEGESGEI